MSSSSSTAFRQMHNLAVTAEDVGGVLKQACEQIAALRAALGK